MRRNKLHRTGFCCVVFLSLSSVASFAADSSNKPRTGKSKDAQSTDKATEKPTATDDSDAPAQGDGVKFIQRAFAMNKTADNEAAFTEIINLCRDGLSAGADNQWSKYARQLMAWAYNRRGEIRADAEQNTEALDDFDAAVSLDTSKWRHVHNRGVSYATLGKYDEAIEDFNETIRMNPNYGNAYFNRGELRYEQEDFDTAIQDYTQAIRLLPRDSAAYNSRGHARYRLHQFREALADYSQAVALDPQNAAAYTNRGDAFADLGRWAEAASDYRTAIRLNPRLGRAYQSAAWLMATCPNAQFRKSDLAVEAAQKAIDLDGKDDYRYFETLAAAQASAGDFASAIEAQEKVVEMVPSEQRSRAEGRLELYKRDTPYLELPREPAQASSSRQARRSAKK